MRPNSHQSRSDTVRRFLEKALTCVLSAISVLLLTSCSSIHQTQMGQGDVLSTNSQGLVYVKSETTGHPLLNDEASAMNLLLAAAYNNRGMISMEQGKYDEAIWDFSRATEIDPRFASAYSNRARAYVVKGNYEQAIRDLDAALALDEITHR